MIASATRGAPTAPAEAKKRIVLSLRWVVIITVSYVVLFGRPMAATNPRALVFIAVFLTTNLVAGRVPTTAFHAGWFRSALVLFDTCWISGGMYLAGQDGNELFLLYFSILFLAALGESEALIAGGCALVALLYLLFLLRTESMAEILKPAVLLRIPFLFGIGTFYGHLVSIAKQERHAAELARQRGRVRTDLLATLTHDLQTPLTAIAGMADLLIGDPEALDHAGRRVLYQSIKKAATESAELVATFLSLASAEAATQPFHRALVDLNSVAQAALEHHRHAAAERGVELVVSLAERLPVVSGDRAQLQRAISNLLANAVKFVSTGGRVELATANDTSAVTVSVSDDGPGIPIAIRDHVFEPYVSEGESAGSGLGLFIVQLIAAAHGGAVTMQSRRGGGTRFTLRFPVPADVQVVPFV